MDLFVYAVLASFKFVTIFVHEVKMLKFINNSCATNGVRLCMTLYVHFVMGTLSCVYALYRTSSDTIGQLLVVASSQENTRATLKGALDTIYFVKRWVSAEQFLFDKLIVNLPVFGKIWS